MAASSRILKIPPRTGLRYFSWICMAVKAMFHSRVSSSSRPTPRRSSDTNAMPISQGGLAGLVEGHRLAVQQHLAAGRGTGP